MCFQVYLGSYRECSEIPYVKGSNKIFVHRHPEHNRFFRGASILGLTAPYQYHLGVMDCGCGFSYNSPDSWRYDAHRQLGDYLALCVQRSEPIELVSFWADDEECPIEKHRHITFDELFNPLFYFEERQLTVVYKDKESLNAAKRLS